VTPTTAQVLLAAMFLGGAILFVMLDQSQLAVALIGALAGQGAGAGVRSATNGNGGNRK
jgi:hypothetical protein